MVAINVLLFFILLYIYHYRYLVNAKNVKNNEKSLWNFISSDFNKHDQFPIVDIDFPNFVTILTNY